MTCHSFSSVPSGASSCVKNNGGEKIEEWDARGQDRKEQTGREQRSRCFLLSSHIQRKWWVGGGACCEGERGRETWGASSCSWFGCVYIHLLLLNELALVCVRAPFEVCEIQQQDNSVDRMRSNSKLLTSSTASDCMIVWMVAKSPCQKHHPHTENTCTHWQRDPRWLSTCGRAWLTRAASALVHYCGPDAYYVYFPSPYSA